LNGIDVCGMNVHSYLSEVEMLEVVYFDEDIFDDDEDILCPSCNETIYSEDAYEMEDDDE
ncbi:MAG TPA: hypothetical protein DIW17_10510, partial [Clostridiales bacterium]|nr:hypothetical protein [Clostridiales bacterium]